MALSGLTTFLYELISGVVAAAVWRRKQPVMLIALWTSKGSVEWQTTKHTMVICSFAVLLGVATVLWTLGVYSMS